MHKRDAYATAAFTLLEMLIAMALTLIMVGAIAEFYAYVGETIKDGRAMITMSSQLRGAIQRLKTDLDLITVPMAPPVDDSSGLGYFEIAEGIGKDWDPANLRNADLSYISGSPPAAQFSEWESLYGDIDDVIANMADIQLRRLPVVDRDKRLVGIVSLGDIATTGNDVEAGEALAGISMPGGQHSQTR